MIIKPMRKTCLVKRIFWRFICLAVCLLVTAYVTAAEDAHFGVLLVETDAEDCLAHGGKLVSLQRNVDSPSEVEVWVDRWFMNVQTADHTKHRLSPDVAIADLGCSITGSGAQRWTIHTVIAVPK